MSQANSTKPSKSIHTPSVVSSKNPVYAAAFQDHFARSLSLNPHPVSYKAPKLPSSVSSKYKPVLNHQQRLLAKWTRETERKHRVLHTAPITMAPRLDKGKKPSANETSSRSILEMEQERVLDPPPVPLTLAQKLGLITQPPPRLTPSQWAQVKSASLTRNDTACPICQEGFTNQGQVLLSCSHVYHRDCLESYEKFVRQKRCPMCRSEGYEKRVSVEGKRAYLHQCAVK